MFESLNDKSEVLKNYKIAILATDGFEQSELIEPKKALEDAGADVDVVAPKSGSIRGWNNKDWGDDVDVDVDLDQARSETYSALVLPGGVMNPDNLRMNSMAVEFVRDFVLAGKPIGAICHGPWTLIDAGGVAGKKITSFPSLKIDLTNAGANWVDEEVVTDQGLVTSRTPADLPAFNRKLIEEIREGQHYGSSSNVSSVA